MEANKMLHFDIPALIRHKLPKNAKFVSVSRQIDFPDRALMCHNRTEQDPLVDRPTSTYRL
jgi:hypothetical protein